MEDLKTILAERLSEIFGDERQQKIANMFYTTQGTVSKWVKGESIPGPETLVEIAKTYHVSVDWLLGLSDERETEILSVEDLTYEQVALILHYLFELGGIEVPNRDMMKKDAEGVKDNTDYIKVNDNALSFLLRRRWAVSGVGEEYLPTWVDTEVRPFNGVRLIKYNDKFQEMVKSRPWPGYKAGDWAALINEFRDMLKQERIEKNKNGEDNG